MEKKAKKIKGEKEDVKTKNKKNNKKKNDKGKKIDKTDKKKNDLKYDYEIKCLLIHRLKKGDVIELISSEVKTLCKIVEISDISDFIMTLKVLVVNK